MRNRTVITEDFEGFDYELEFEPVGDILKAKVGDKVVIAYLVRDDDYRDIDDMMGDCMGKLLSFHGHSKDIAEGLTALGKDSDGEPDLDAVWDEHWEAATRRYVAMAMRDATPDQIIEQFEEDPCDMPEAVEVARDLLEQDCVGVSRWDRVLYEESMLQVLLEMWSEPEYFPGDPDAQLLDCYDHSGQHWSLSGGGMQCRWDTASGAGVWQPDKYLRQQIDSDVAEGKDRQAQCRIYAQQFLDQFNAIISGDVYGCVVETFELEGDQIESDSCWGFVGGEYAEESLKDCFFDPTCEALAKQYEEDVRTQNGTQMEIV